MAKSLPSLSVDQPDDADFVTSPGGTDTQRGEILPRSKKTYSFERGRETKMLLNDVVTRLGREPRALALKAPTLLKEIDTITSRGVQ